MADNLLLGAEVILEDSSNLQKDILSKIDDLQKKMDKDPLEMKITVGEMKGLATSLTKVRKEVEKEAEKIGKAMTALGSPSEFTSDQKQYYNQLLEKQVQLNELSGVLLNTQSRIRAEASQINSEANGITSALSRAEREAEKLEAKFMGISDTQKASIASYDISAISGATEEHIIGMRNYASYLKLQTKEMSNEWSQFEYIIQRINILLGDTAAESKNIANQTKGLSSGYIDMDEALDEVAIIDEINKETEESIRLEKEHEATTKQREAIVSRLTKLYANLTSEQRRQVRLGSIGNISTESEAVLKSMIKYSKEYTKQIGLSSDEVKTQESLVKSLELKILNVSKAAKIASAEYQALSTYILEGNVEDTDTTLDNSTLTERLKMSELIASTLDRQSAEYAKHVAYQQSITAALKYQSVEALKSMEAQAAAMDTSSIEARNAKIAVLEKLIRSVNDETEEGKKKQDEWANSISKLNAENAKFTSRTAELKKQTAATEASTKATEEQARIEKSIISILSGAATTENAINEAIRERVKLQGTLEIGNEEYLQNQREVLQLQQKLPASIRSASQEYTKQASVVQQMKGMVDNYIGLYAAFRGMNSIVQTTADFEMQRVALTALSGSMIDTEKIWSQIAAQSVKSPFALKDLVTYTKQLSAYRIENDKLFDTTKQLADISAGLGVEMDRIILAYGQVKAATVLRGTELRQFTEAGFDLLPALAQKFTELNGTVVTTAEVFDLISQRAVPFEMVAEVFDDMTAAGGRFYNMQEVQSDTTRGLLINIQDQADLTKVALGEMNSELIKGVLSGSKSVLEFAANNAGLANVILTVVAAGAAYALSLGIQSEIQRRYNADVMSGITAKRLEKLGFDESSISIIKNTAALKGAAYATELNAIELKNATWRQKLFIAGQKQAALSTNLFSTSLAKLKIALASNPWTLGIVALTSLISLGASWIGNNNQQIEKIKEMRVELERLTAERAKSEKVLREATDFEDQIKAFENYKELLEGQGINIKLNIDKDNVVESIEAVIAEANALAAAKGRITIALAEESPISRDSSWYNPFSWVDDMTDSYGDVMLKMNDYQLALLSEINTLSLTKSPTNEQIDRLKKLESANEKLIKVSNESKSEYDRLSKSAAIYSDVLSDIDTKTKVTTTTYGARSESQYSDILANLNTFANKYKSTSNNILSYVKETVDLTSSSSAGQIELAINEAASKANMQQFIPDFIRDIEKQLGVTLEISVDSPKSALKEWQKEYNDFVDSIEARKVGKPIDVTLKSVVDPRDFVSGIFKNIQGEADKQQITIGSGVLLPETELVYDNTELRNYLNQFRITENMSTVEQTEMASKLNTELEKQKNILKEIEAGTKSYQGIDANSIKDNIKYITQMRDQMSLLTKDQTDASKTSAAVSLLKEELSLLDAVNKAYADNLKVMSSDAAAKSITDLYGDVFDDLKNFEGLEPTDVIDTEGLNKQYEIAKTIINKLLGEGTAKANKVILEFDKTIAKNSSAEAMAIIKAEIAKLNSDIAKQQEASNFMDKILGLTSGNMELATSITMSVYGNTGEELEKAMVEQVRKAFSGSGVSSAVADGVEDAIDGTDIDFVALQGLISQLPTNMQSAAEKIVKEGISANAKIVEDLYKNLSKTKTYEDKRTDILRAGIKQRREIEESDLKDSEKAYFTGLSEESQSKQLQQLEYEDFTESDTYVQMFERLETISTTTLEAMKAKLEGLRGALKDGLEPTQLKELQSRLSEIGDEIDSRSNPFKLLKESLTEYREELAKASLEQRETELFEAQTVQSKSQAGVDSASEDLVNQEYELAIAKQALLEAELSGNEVSIEAATKKVALEQEGYDFSLNAYNLMTGINKENKKSVAYRQQEVNVVTNLSARIVKLRSATIAMGKQLVSSMVDFADASNDAIQAGVFGNLSDEAKDVADDVLSVASTIGSVTIATIGNIQSIVSGSAAAMVGASTSAAAAIKSVERASIILAIISAVLQIATKIAQVISGNNEAKVDDAIEDYQLEVDSLSNSIEDLGDVADESFGKLKIAALSAQDELKEQQALAYDAMILAEQSRKDPDEAQIAEWQREAEVLRNEIKDTGEYFEAYLGTSTTDLMTALKDAWADLWDDIDATATDKMNAMKDAWRETLQNMVYEQMVMGIIEAQMSDLFDDIENTIEASGGVVSADQISGWLYEGDAKIEALMPQLELIDQWMEDNGFSSVSSSDSDGSLSQGIASATSEEVTTLSGYMSSVLQYQILSYNILDRWEQNGYNGVTIASTDAEAQDSTFYLSAIQTNTLNAANTLARIESILDGVTTPIGSDKGLSINVDVVG